MSVLAAMQRREVCTNAVERDHALIETLQSLMPDKHRYVSEIVCYFRRPDRYAESLYSQHVKRGIIFDGTFEEFLPIIRPALFYDKHMKSWSDAFGESNCIVRLYEPVRADIVSDFVREVLGIDDVAQFSRSHNQGNERVSRDVLEFKRLRNETAKANERDIERTILRLVDEEMELRKSEPECYQDFLSPDRACRTLGPRPARDGSLTEKPQRTSLPGLRSGQSEGELESLSGLGPAAQARDSMAVRPDQ